ncbi:hypothetical protein [Gordonia sp. FQ]|uniref:hypothetical protein n=1 Tax=Gordonia sp. FQ TaxID=3446634 RepID=UPI003F85E264
MHRIVSAFAALAVGALLLTGCSSDDLTKTSCKDYNKMSSSRQDDVVRALLKKRSKSGDSDDTGGVAIQLNKTSVSGFCQSAPYSSVDQALTL